MGVGYFQLTVINENDKYLIGNPQFTYFKAVYKRHTNFAKENILLNFTGDTHVKSESTFNQRFYTTIPKNADLVHKMYLAIDISSNDNMTPGAAQNITNNAFALIDTVEITIGDQVIDRHSGEWFSIYNELFINEDKNQSICDMINIYTNAKQPSASEHKGDGMIYIPLNFWFNRNAGLSLPLLALQYSDVKINLKLNSKSKFINDPALANPININNIKLLTEFIHLDNNEKMLFSSKPHEYLIEQLQYSIREPIDNKTDLSDTEFNKYQHKLELSFNHPVKELLWVIQDDYQDKATPDKYARGNHLFNFWRDLDDTNRPHQIIDATIALNGSELFEPLNSNYFNAIVKHQHHSGYGYVDLNTTTGTSQQKSNFTKGSGVYCYSFALNPEDYQPSGTLNFSKIDRTELRVRINKYQYDNITRSTVQKYIRVYAINYNILRIASGSGGLLFQN